MWKDGTMVPDIRQCDCTRVQGDWATSKVQAMHGIRVKVRVPDGTRWNDSTRVPDSKMV